jgi:stearoyl-CoA desaturase (delta-9 desaturase)
MTTESMPREGPKPILGPPRSLGTRIGVWVGVTLPTLVFPVAIAMGWLSWLNFWLLVGFTFFALLGVTTSYHRYLTHGAFKAKRWLRNTLAVWGEFGTQGDPITWVADHRRHHAFSDREGDPHSPWLFGTGPIALVKGFWHAHMGWLFGRDKTNKERFAPDLLADKDIVRISRLFPLVTVIQLALLPGLIGGLVTQSWGGAVTAFIWGGIVRVALVHHITWSTNSICHMVDERPYESRDKASNVRWLAILSMGESWHNYHHADPTSARHGVGPWEFDITARLIWIFEKFGWVWAVRWPTPQQIAKKRQVKTGAAS